MNEDTESTNCDYVIRAHQLCMALNNIMLLINSTHDADTIFHEIVEESCKALGCESALIAMRENDRWVVRNINKLPDELLGRAFTDEEFPHAYLSMITRMPVAINDAINDNRTNTEMMQSLGLKSVIVLPLMVENTVIGTLSFGYHSEAVSFTDAETDYAEIVVTGVAIALQNARMYQDLLRTETEMKEAKKLGDALNEIDIVLYSMQNYDVTMQKILQIATEAIGAETAIIFSKDGDKWVIRYAHKLSRSLIGRVFSNSAVLHAALTATTTRSLVIADAVNSRDASQEFVKMFGIRSLLDFPLIIHGEVIADLSFHYHSAPVPFSARQVEFVGKLQNSLSLALENSRLLDSARQSESRLKEAEKLGKFGYFHYDIHTGKITWSEGMFQVFARDPRLGEPTVEEFFTLYACDPGIEEMKNIVAKQDASEFDAKAQRMNEVFDVHMTIRVLKDDTGETLACFGTIQDITEQKRAELLLRQSESFKQAILDSLPAHIAVLDQQGIILAVNRSWLRFAEQNGLSDARSVRVGADYLAVCRRAADLSDPLALEALSGIEDVLSERKSEFRLNYPCHSPTGERWYMMNVVRPEHEMHGVIITHLDITDRIHAEHEIREVNRELEAFNFTVAHDLRKPLTVINGYAQAQMEMCSDQQDSHCKDYSRQIYEGTLRMNRLIEALLNFSRVGYIELKRERLNLCSMCKEVAAELKQAEPQRHVIFHIPEGIEALADPDLLRVVMTNLFGNAWKYTGIREKAVIEFGMEETGGEKTYHVRDNGPGFEPAEADRLFAPFQRLECGKKIEGIGIGLATVARVIKRHGGRVWARGEPGKGATFYFTLGEI